MKLSQHRKSRWYLEEYRKKYIRTAELKGNLLRELALKADYELEKLFAEPAIESRDRNLDMLPFLPYMEKALKDTGVNR